MPFEQIDIHQAKELINQGNVTVVDIRDPDSYRGAHIQNAVAVNDENIDSFLRQANRSKPLICYCYHGFSSQGAAEYFGQNGFSKVYSIIGGFEEWRKVYPCSEGPSTN